MAHLSHLIPNNFQAFYICWGKIDYLTDRPISSQAFSQNNMLYQTLIHDDRFSIKFSLIWFENWSTNDNIYTLQTISTKIESMAELLKGISVKGPIYIIDCTFWFIDYWQMKYMCNGSFGYIIYYHYNVFFV